MSDDTTTSLIAARADFKLYHRPERGDRGWQNFKLVLTTRRAPKHNWHLGWNPREQRLARNSDNDLLREHYPAIHDWVLCELRQHPEAEPVERDVVDADDATNVDNAANASVAAIASADTVVYVIDARADTLARAAEDDRRWREAQQAQRRQAEEQRQREAEANASWRRGQFNNYVLGLAFPDLNSMTGRPRTVWDSLPPPPRLYR